MTELQMLYREVSPYMSANVEVSLVVDVHPDCTKVRHIGFGTADYVEYTEAFYKELVDSYNPICVHTHLDQGPIPSLSDLITWCSNEDITNTAIFGVGFDEVLDVVYASAMLFEKNEEYITPDEVYDVWQKHMKDANSISQVFRNILHDLSIIVLEEREFNLSSEG